MNETLDIITARHSYRGAFKAQSVPREHLTAIMQAGLDAPSGCNKQTTSLIAVDEPQLLSELLGMIDPPICQTAPAVICVLTQRICPICQTAPAVICVLTQRICAYRDRCFAVQDYSAAIQNMLLAIKSLGYDSCWYEGHITDEDNIGGQLAKRLGVPEGYELVCVLPVGIAAEEIKAPRKMDFGERAWFNGFGAKE